MESNGSRSRKTKDYWTYLEDNYKEVSNWPTWMRGESSSSVNSLRWTKLDMLKQTNLPSDEVTL